MTILTEEGVIVYPEEEQVIALSAENLRKCGGARARTLRVRGPRRVKLVPQKVAKRRRRIEIIVIDDDDDIAHPPGSRTRLWGPGARGGNWKHKCGVDVGIAE